MSLQSSSSSSTRIRCLQADDRQRWGELWAQYLTFYQQELPAAVTDLTWRRLLEARELHGFAALDEADRMVGCVHYHIHLSTWSHSMLAQASGAQTSRPLTPAVASRMPSEF